MRHGNLVVGSIVLWLVASVVTVIAQSPKKTVEVYIEANRQGRFAAAQGLLLEQIDMRASLFGNWLFAPSTSAAQAATADIFLSRKFTEAFSFKIVGTTRNGENLAFVSGIRTSPNIQHLYTWAVAPQRGSTPYALIESIDVYLTKINYPLEDSRMTFTLVRELDHWLISAIDDEKFGQFSQSERGEPSTRTSNAAETPVVKSGMLLRDDGLASAPSSIVGRASTSPLVKSPGIKTPAVAAPGSGKDSGRQLADAQFHATLQSLNRAALPEPRPDATSKSDVQPQKKGILSKIASIFSRGKKRDGLAVTITAPRIASTFQNIRDALALYAVSNNSVPIESDIYDWTSLREVVNFHSKQALPISEKLAGFSFVDYRVDGLDNYVLLVALHSPQDGLEKVEIGPYGLERVR